MTKPNYSLLHTIIHQIASTRPGAWFLARTLHHFDRAALSLSRGRVTLTSILTGLPVVILTTLGAKSGRVRTLPLLFIRDENDTRRFALIATNFGQQHYPAWFFNLKKNPEAACSIDGQGGKYIAHEAEGEEYERFWKFAEGTYMGYALYKQRISNRRIPIMVMTPVEPQFSDLSRT